MGSQTRRRGRESNPLRPTALALVAAGHTYPAVAAELGVSRDTVRWWVREARKPDRPSGALDETPAVGEVRYPLALASAMAAWHSRVLAGGDRLGRSSLQADAYLR